MSEKSIAVLPLENLTEEKENASFANGIQDELLSNLAKIKVLKVISRTSVVGSRAGLPQSQGGRSATGGEQGGGRQRASVRKSYSGFGPAS